MTGEHDQGTDSDCEVIRASLSTASAFAVVFDRHFDSIFGYLVRRVGMDDAGDLAADVFVAAFAARSKFDCAISESARPWLFGIASRVAARHARQSARQKRAYARSFDRGDAYLDTDAAERGLLADSVRPQLDEAVAALSPELRDVLLLVAVHGLAYQECADALDIPIGTVQSRLSRARQRLRAQLDRRWAKTTNGEEGDR